MKRSIMFTAGLLTLSSAAMASDQLGTTADQWREELSGGIQGLNDAGFLPATANVTRGDGPLNRITGTLSATAFGSLDADVFQITITDPSAFSATVGGTNDSVLALFHLDGRGIAFNDDRTDSATSRAARLTNTLTSSLSSGQYLLAISRNNTLAGLVNFTRPLDAAAALMFTGQAQLTATNDAMRRMEYGPLDPMAVLTSWEGYTSNALPFGFNYTVTLTGAGYAQLPAPGAAALLGLAGLAAARRRR